MLTSCVTKLRQFRNAWNSGKAPSAQDQKLIPFFIVISSLMVSSCDLDSVKAEKQGKCASRRQTSVLTASAADIAAALEKWSQASASLYLQGPFSNHICSTRDRSDNMYMSYSWTCGNRVLKTESDMLLSKA